MIIRVNMKQLYKYIEEGLLGGMEDILDRGEEDLRKAFNVPTIKDFRGTSGNRFIRIIDWICPELFEKYEIVNIPTAFVYIKGTCVLEYHGYFSVDDLMRYTENYIYVMEVLS